MRNILITGGAGFIGSNFINFFSRKYKYKVINLDLLTYASNISNVSIDNNQGNYKFIHGDICDRELVENIFSKEKIDAVVHFAAESHVDNSIENPEKFIKTNVLGTFVLLDVARSFWKEDKNIFLNVSTDEVFGSLDDENLFHESSNLAPNSPYSASKAGSNLLGRSYFKTYGMNVITTNCSNNFGPNQHDEKLIPTIIRNAIKQKAIPIYGSGENIRDWLFVEDHCRALDLVLHKGRAGEVYNIGASNELSNNKIAEIICSELDILLPKQQKYFKLVDYVEDRKGHDYRYAIDSTKISKEIGWKKKYSFTDALRKTIAFYIKKYR